MIPCIGITGELENSQTEEVISMITSEQTTKTYKPEAVSIITGKSSYLSFCFINNKLMIVHTLFNVLLQIISLRGRTGCDRDEVR